MSFHIRPATEQDIVSTHLSIYPFNHIFSNTYILPYFHYTLTIFTQITDHQTKRTRYQAQSKNWFVYTVVLVCHKEIRILTEFINLLIISDNKYLLSKSPDNSDTLLGNDIEKIKRLYMRRLKSMLRPLQNWYVSILQMHYYPPSSSP